MMAERVNLIIEDGTREKLIELAGGERKLGEYISSLVSEEWQRQQVDVSKLAERLQALERLVHTWRVYAVRNGWFHSESTDATRAFHHILSEFGGRCPLCTFELRRESEDLVVCDACGAQYHWPEKRE